MTKPSMSGLRRGRFRTDILGLSCLTAVGAAILATAVFGLLTPPLDSATLLSPPKERPTSVRAIATELPTVPPLLTEDNFSAEANWAPADDNGSVSFTKKGLVLSPFPNGKVTHLYLKDFAKTGYHDLSLQVEAGPLAGSAGGNYGIFFGHGQDKLGQERFLYFGVDTDAAYSLRALVPMTETAATPTISRMVDLIPATASPSIHKNGEPNKLRVDIHPNRILAFVNGSLVVDGDLAAANSLMNRDDLDGKVGVIAYSFGDAGFQAVFSLFDLYVNLQKLP